MATVRIRPIYRWLHVKKNTTHKENIYTIKINATTYVVDTETTLFSVQPIQMATAWLTLYGTMKSISDPMPGAQLIISAFFLRQTVLVNFPM